LASAGKIPILNLEHQQIFSQVSGHLERDFPTEVESIQSLRPKSATLEPNHGLKMDNTPSIKGYADREACGRQEPKAVSPSMQLDFHPDQACNRVQ
jgi:hypothetical protein